MLYEALALKNRQERVISQQVSYLLTSAMQDVFRRGTASRYKTFHKWAAGKTGTSDAAKDNWFCGFSQDVVTVVWLGKDDFSKNSRNAYGSTIALPIWAKYMHAIVKNKRRFPVPAGVLSAKVDPRYGTLNSRGITMYFLAGDFPTHKYSPFQGMSRQENTRTRWN